MKRPGSSFIALAVGGAVAFAGPVFATPLYSPVVARLGDGTGRFDPLIVTNTAVTTDIQVYQPSLPNQGAPVAQLHYADGSLVTNATPVFDGQLTNNPGLIDAATKGLLYNATNYVFSGGYAAANGTSSVDLGTSGINRVVGYMTVTPSSVSNPIIGASQASSVTFAGGALRAAVGDDTPTNFWAAGSGGAASASGGYRYMNTNTQITPSPDNTRTIQIRQGQLYGSSSIVNFGPPTSNFIGIQKLGTGKPTTSGNIATPLFQTGTDANASSPDAFVLMDDPNVATPTTPNVPFNVAYIANVGSNSPGIQKWVFNPANVATNNGWSLAYTITDGSAGGGYWGLAGQLDGGNVILYATSNTTTPSGTSVGSQNNLEQFTDPLENGSATAADATEIVLATAGPNFVFRGVALTDPAPVPEPASIGLVTASVVGMIRRRRAR